MKKIFFVLLLTMITLMTASVIAEVSAYSPDYLPGGKNYLAETNFEMQGSQYVSKDSFLVKSFTEYTLTIPGFYAEELFAWATWAFLDNGEYLDDMGIGPTGMTHYNDGTSDWYSYTFTTSAETNYLNLMFSDTDGYFLANGFYGFQLEEGDSFTGYEPYVDGNLVDTNAPYFQTHGTIISYFDSPITIEEIQAALVAYDDIDGDVTANIELITDGYSANAATLGTYEVIFQASDASGNISTTTIRIEVVDVLKPVFSEIGTVTAVFPNIFTPEEIRLLMTASDNYDGDISGDIVLVSDGYTENSEIVGIYPLEFSVTDSSGNTAYHIQYVEVVDAEGPIISGITSVAVGYDSLITPEEIMSNLGYTDNYDGSESLQLVLESDAYTENHNELGLYAMTFSVTDSSGNTTYQTVEIQVVDELGPIVYFDDSIIRTYNDTVMSLPDFLQLMVNTNQIDGTSEYTVSILYDSYTRNANIPGTYHLTLKYVADDGTSFEKTLEIKVLERSPDYINPGISDSTENETALSQIKDYIVTGVVGLLLVISNVVWVIVFKKK